MKVVVTVEVDVEVDVPTHNAGLAERAVAQEWESNWRGYARPRMVDVWKLGRAVRVRAKEEADGE